MSVDLAREIEEVLDRAASVPFFFQRNLGASALGSENLCQRSADFIRTAQHCSVFALAWFDRRQKLVDASVESGAIFCHIELAAHGATERKFGARLMAA